MFNSKWIGIINWDDGIYYNNTNIKKQNIKKIQYQILKL